MDHHTQKRDALTTVREMRLATVDRQLQLAFQIRAGHGQRIVSRRLRSTQDQDVVRIADDPVPPAFHVLIEGVQIDVGDQRTDHPALRTALWGGLILVTDHYATAQELPEQPQDTAIRYLTPEPADDEIVVQCVKALGQIHIHHPLAVVATNEQLGFGNGVVGTSTRSVAVARRVEIPIALCGHIAKRHRSGLGSSDRVRRGASALAIYRPTRTYSRIQTRV